MGNDFLQYDLSRFLVRSLQIDSLKTTLIPCLTRPSWSSLLSFRLLSVPSPQKDVPEARSAYLTSSSNRAYISTHVTRSRRSARGLSVKLSHNFFPRVGMSLQLIMASSFEHSSISLYNSSTFCYSLRVSYSKALRSVIREFTPFDTLVLITN